MSRLRLFGVASRAGRERAGLHRLSALPPPELAVALRACCGSSAWVSAMVDACAKDAGVFASLAALNIVAADVWNGLATADWDEAFRAHPRIGETKAENPQSTLARGWSSGEQSRMSEAGDAVKRELREINAAYERRFGRIYIVCATGLSAEELLAIAKVRLDSDPETELRRAADEQRKITELRLEKWVLA